ncbi:hypothetical protein J6590_104645, partial [Homalodisca vitripennis]
SPNAQSSAAQRVRERAMAPRANPVDCPLPGSTLCSVNYLGRHCLQAYKGMFYNTDYTNKGTKV